MFVETPNSSLRHADLFDFCECPRPDPRGISETPARRKRRDARPSCGNHLRTARALVRRSARMPLDTLVAAGIIGPVRRGTSACGLLRAGVALTWRADGERRPRCRGLGGCAGAWAASDNGRHVNPRATGSGDRSNASYSPRVDRRSARRPSRRSRVPNPSAVLGPSTAARGRSVGTRSFPHR